MKHILPESIGIWTNARVEPPEPNINYPLRLINNHDDYDVGRLDVSGGFGHSRLFLGARKVHTINEVEWLKPFT